MKNNNMKKNLEIEISKGILLGIFVKSQYLSHFSMCCCSHCSIVSEVSQNSPWQQEEKHNLNSSCCISIGVPPFLPGGNRGSQLPLMRKGKSPFCESQLVGQPTAAPGKKWQGHKSSAVRIQQNSLSATLEQHHIWNLWPSHWTRETRQHPCTPIRERNKSSPCQSCLSQ